MATTTSTTTSSSDVISPKLGENNYHSWVIKMKALLMSKKLWLHVKGAISKPPNDAVGFQDFTLNSYAASGLILLNIEESQYTHVEGMEEDPSKMWITLEGIHIQKRPNTRFMAYSNLLSITKQPDESLPSVTTRVEQALKDVKTLCPKDYTLDKLYDDLSCMAMIRSLPADYSSFVSAITLMEQLDMSKLKSAFITEESNRKAMEGHFGLSAAAHLSSTITTKPTSTIICGWCERPGHVEDNCFTKKASQQQDRANAKARRSRGKKPTNSRFTSPSNNKPSANTASISPVTEQAVNASVFNTSDATTSQLTPSLDWCADSGATSHMTPHRDWFVDYSPQVIPIMIADGTTIYSTGIGSVQFRPFLRGASGKAVVFQNVLHVPCLSRPLLSMTKLTLETGFKIVMWKDNIYFHHKGPLIMIAKLKGTLAHLVGTTLIHPSASPTTALNTTAAPLDISLWHRRFSHLNYGDLKSMINKGLVRGVNIQSQSTPDPICEPCLAGNMRRIIKKTAKHDEHNLDVIYSDLHGPMPVQALDGSRYWCLFVDGHSRFWALYFLRTKDQTFEVFKKFKAWVELATGNRIKALQDDKGGEYMSKAMEEYLTAEGIQRRHTMRAEPHSNGIAERANGIIANRATSLLYESKLPPSFWKHAVAVVCHTHNRMPTSPLPTSTPHETLFGNKPDVSHLRVFGSLAYVHIKKDKRYGLSSHMEKAIFIGYPPQYKGWEFYNPATKKIILSDRADFDERICPGTHIYYPTQLPPIPLPPTPTPLPDAPLNLHMPDVPNQVGDVPLQVGVDPAPLAPQDQSLPPSPSPSQSPPPSPQLRRSTRVRTDPADWKQNWYKPGYKPLAERIREQEQHSNSDDANSGSEGSQPESTNFVQDSTSYLTLAEALEYAHFIAAEALSATARSNCPRTYVEAMTRPDAQQYHEAACKEIEALLDNKTWELAKLPPGRKAIGSRWVFLIKHKADGTIDRYKARLVIQGFSQRPGLDYGETFATTIKWPTLRIILALAAFEDLEIESVDISSAFLNGDIDTEIYMQQPEGFPQGEKGDVLKLKKSLYGLKQAPRIWHEKLDSVLSLIGFQKVQSDHSLWIYMKDGVRIIVPVFVDDLTIVARDKSSINSVITHLEKHFKLRRLGPIDFLLGVKIRRDRTKYTIHLSQKQYILDMLARYGFSDCTPVQTPINPGTNLSEKQCPTTPEDIEEMRSVPYISAVGSLLYLAIATRPDIAYTVGLLARFNINPGKAHWAAVKHLFRYLKGTMDMELTFSPDTTTSELFVGYSDADHGGDKDSGYSTGAYVIKIGNGVISWKSKLQNVVTLSTTEAEYIAAVHTGQELKWLHNLLTELGYTFKDPHTLYIDNLSAISVTQNPEHHGRMKHLDLKYYWLRDEVTKKKTLKTVHCPTDFMPADILTKPLPLGKVKTAYGLLGLTRFGGSNNAE
jgi:Reverse transcriptase (RNA-dependent DNA polymerase)/gag-polypeptide of LTR copia-type/GAG-pre-integrase domain